ncbi:MAG: hypothetical protein ACKVOE_10605 [Rickettsiales bacterium]
MKIVTHHPAADCTVHLPAATAAESYPETKQKALLDTIRHMPWYREIMLALEADQAHGSQSIFANGHDAYIKHLDSYLFRFAQAEKRDAPQAWNDVYTITDQFYEAMPNVARPTLEQFMSQLPELLEERAVIARTARHIALHHVDIVRRGDQSSEPVSDEAREFRINAAYQAILHIQFSSNSDSWHSTALAAINQRTQEAETQSDEATLEALDRAQTELKIAVRSLAQAVASQYETSNPKALATAKHKLGEALQTLRGVAPEAAEGLPGIEAFFIRSAAAAYDEVQKILPKRERH